MYELKRAHFEKVYGPHLGAFIANRLARMVKQCNDGCMDNERIARSDEPDTVARYEEARKRGCCGSIDERFTYTRDGVTFEVLIGFNYGH